ncbi:MAG: GNAT family N-acetyltransferase [Alphaproteobacteria bacterium]
MDLWIQAQALNGKARADMPLRFVIAPGSGELIGYYLLISAEVPRLGLPSAKLRRNKPNSIPAVKLAQMAVEKRFQGKGFGRRMLLCAMAEAVSVATVQQQTAFILDPVDDSARAFYSRFSFETLKDSGTMLLAMGTVRQLLAAWNAE